MYEGSVESHLEEPVFLYCSGQTSPDVYALMGQDIHGSCIQYVSDRTQVFCNVAGRQVEVF